MQQAMAKLLLHIMLLGLLTAAVAGCTGTPDGRLTAADSLMWTRPDSSLIRLAEVDTCQLGEADRAYYALLLTQANYRNYIKATSDSMINRAVAYYEHHGPQERLTRALLYRGAVLDELGRPADAMLSYKKAEFAADTADYRNLALIHLGIAEMYKGLYAGNGADIENYEEAYSYFVKTGNKPKQLVCLSSIGQRLRMTNPALAEKYLNKALSLATALNDSNEIYGNLEFLSRCYFINKDYGKAKETALKCIAEGGDWASYDSYINLARTYAKLHKPDSARIYINKWHVDTACDYQRVEYYYTVSDLFTEEGRAVEANALLKLAESLSDSMANTPSLNSIAKIDRDEVNNTLCLNKSDKNSQKRLFVLIIVVVAICFSIVLYLLHSNSRRKSLYIAMLQKQMRDANEKIEAQRHASLLEMMNREKKLRHIISKQIESFQHLISTSYYEPKKFENEFNKAYKLIQEKDQCFWTELQYFVDANYNLIISKCLKANPNLSKEDIGIICLMSCGFSYIEIAICLDYKKEYMSVKRKRIAQKLGLNETLINFVKREAQTQ